jgi:hypothetical protein
VSAQRQRPENTCCNVATSGRGARSQDLFADKKAVMCRFSPKASLDSQAWLLDGGAAERHAALTRLLGAPPDAPEVQEARRAIMTEGPVPRILAEQQADGHWEGPDRFYTAKYRGTVWSLVILAELGADGADPRVRAACEALMRDAQDPDSGGFSTERSKKAGGGLHSWVIPCLTGNLVFSLVRLGMLDDPRVQRAVDSITTYQRFDDAEGDVPTGWPYDKPQTPSQAMHAT